VEHCYSNYFVNNYYYQSFTIIITILNFEYASFTIKCLCWTLSATISQKPNTEQSNFFIKLKTKICKTQELCSEMVLLVSKGIPKLHRCLYTMAYFGAENLS